MLSSLLLLVAAGALLLALATPSVFMHHGLTLPPLGSTDVIDRDAQRVDAELRAMVAMREHG
ncbi:hypothetical protein [Nocardia transvalensis]|uniref:hypothetical protein n=1 Tax=Nocardia transvalensis TaxID=37333 RepID=UPI0018934C71|nr:hypothetical protein [Nocardia transvalensis]MBF6330231.1 hypothetical protein [Nocardia transvalensis]